MNDKNKMRIPRREFMKSTGAGAAGTIVGLTLGAELKEVLAQASRTGKPMLTEGAVNNLFSPGGPNERSKLPGLLAEAKRDVKGFVRNRFTLTPSQDQQLESLSRQQLESISGALEAAERPGSAFVVRFGRIVSDQAEATATKQACKSFEITLKWTF